MRLLYSTSKKTLERGALKHFDYRHKILKYSGPILGVSCLAYGLWIVTSTGGESSGALGGALVGLGVVLSLRRWIYAKKAVRGAFKGRKEGVLVEFSPSIDGLTVKDENGEARCRWDNFVDSHITDEGILIYPTSQIFYWIPVSAVISEGDWGEFTSLISTSIRKTI